MDDLFRDYVMGIIETMSDNEWEERDALLDMLENHLDDLKDDMRIDFFDYLQEIY